MSEARQSERLGRICYIKARIGWRGLSSSEYTEDGPFLIAGQHIRDGQIAWDKCDHISDQRYQESHEIMLRSGDVILTKDGTIGRVARVDELRGDATINGTMMLVRPVRRLDYRYLYHVLNGRSFQKLIEDKVSGSSIPHIFQRDMVELEVDLPSIDHQSKIAELLDTLDEAIRATKAMVTKLKAMKQGLLDDLLTRGIDSKGNLRPPHIEAPHLYKETPLGWLPKGWQNGKLPSLARSDRPVLRTGPFGSSLKGEHWREVGRPVITIGSFGENGFLKPELLFIEERKAIRMVDYEVHEGDIVFSRVADVGRSLVVHAEQAGWIMSSNLMRISIDPSRLLPSLLHAQLRHSSRLRKRMSQLVNSAGRDVANSAILLALDFAVPQPSEQSQIEEAISAIELTLRCEEEQLDKLRLQKSGMMDDLLTGRVSVTPLL